MALLFRRCSWHLFCRTAHQIWNLDLCVIIINLYLSLHNLVSATQLFIWLLIRDVLKKCLILYSLTSTCILPDSVLNLKDTFFKAIWLWSKWFLNRSLLLSVWRFISSICSIANNYARNVLGLTCWLHLLLLLLLNQLLHWAHRHLGDL